MKRICFYAFVLILSTCFLCISGGSQAYASTNSIALQTQMPISAEENMVDDYVYYDGDQNTIATPTPTPTASNKPILSIAGDIGMDFLQNNKINFIVLGILFGALIIIIQKNKTIKKKRKEL